MSIFFPVCGSILVGLSWSLVLVQLLTPRGVPETVDGSPVP